MRTAQDTQKKAVVLLSGGLDSATAAAWLAARGFSLIALTVDYGQRHRAELAAASRVAAALAVEEHLVQSVDLRAMGASALTGSAGVPKQSDPLAAVAATIPVTYVPARNTLFLSLALALAEARGAHDLGIGVNALDYSGYPDCRPEFIRAFEGLANLATREGVEGRPFRLHAPLQELSKAEILQRAYALGVPVEHTLSCYDPGADGSPCTGCDACRLRQRAEAEVAQWQPPGVPGLTMHHGVAAARVHALRHRNLRPHQALDAVRYDIDDQEGTVHFLATLDDNEVGCATLLRNPQGELSQRVGKASQSLGELGLQVRGMAVDPEMRGRGIGAHLLRACQEQARLQDSGIWCNARLRATGIYARCGFRRFGEVYDMPDIGAHVRMEWRP